MSRREVEIETRGLIENSQRCAGRTGIFSMNRQFLDVPARSNIGLNSKVSFSSRRGIRSYLRIVIAAPSFNGIGLYAVD